MNVFGNYARYYDLLYRDKDYRSEAAFVLALIRKHLPDAQRLLELGCGTGTHAQYLAEGGVSVYGVDRSAPMLERAVERRESLPPDVASRLAFSSGDVRDVRLERTFDAVISLFHVVSYQIRNEDVQDTFSTARQHLKSGGIFAFDCWYGPAVLANAPAVRVKRWEDETTRVLRIAEPIVYANDNRVDVSYTILAQDRETGTTEELHELHQMRYLFRPEVEMFASRAALKIIDVREWMTDKEPGLGTWSVCFVARA
jgi:SAM-dependent methyltransferase